MRPITSTAAERIIAAISATSDLYSPRAGERLFAAQSGGRKAKRARQALEKRVDGWFPHSPGAVNAWLLLVTTKAPEWRDHLVAWKESPLTVGQPHEGFYYPDPLGFWTEVRRWALEIFHLVEPSWGVAEALSLTTLVHIGDHPERFTTAFELCQPRVVLFLDEPSWERSGLQLRKIPHYVHDPHRKGQVYEGFWGVTDGVVVGKSPQHPTMHRLYRTEDMAGFLRSAPIDAR